MRYQVECEKRNSVSPSNHVLFCFLYKHLAKKKLTPFTFQEENALVFVRGAKYIGWRVSSWLAISNMCKNCHNFSGVEFPVKYVRLYIRNNINYRITITKYLNHCCGLLFQLKSTEYSILFKRNWLPVKIASYMYFKFVFCGHYARPFHGVVMLT